MTPELKASLKWHWKFWARPDQLPPEGDEWATWLILAGRGWGKTRVGAETIREWVCGDSPLAPGRFSRIALVAETAADARDVMVEGDSGILGVHPKDFRPNYQPSIRKLTWPNGAVAHLYNATEPDQLRGPQHDAAWCDELAKWRYAQATWDQLQFGLRLGEAPKAIVTTTPRPIPVVRGIMADSLTHTTRGSTKDNKDNLARPFLAQIENKYAGTRLGRQELDGEILNDIPGALWTRTSIDGHRVNAAPESLSRIVVAVDPAASSGENADETGIVGCAVGADEDGYQRGYVLADKSINGTPEEWARAAVALYRDLDADIIIAEKNNGGEMVESVIKAIDRNVPVKLVHASRGKFVRAEPISALYEQGRIHHVGQFNELEDQMCTFSPDQDRKINGSPDRMDALVWGMSELFNKMTSRRKKSDSSEELQNFDAKQNQLANIETGWMA
jgi:phage terminase large subunit-like protein